MAYRICAEDDVGMVDCELEAAEALAGLAHSAASDASPSLPKTTSPPPLHSDHETMPPSHNIEKSLPNILGGENEFEISPGLACTFDYPSVAGTKSRQNLTEAEKEARRLRRILANRESARQTIRRRQAMYEELTKKAAHLALENENLKREKELAAKEYDCLKSTNNSLKAQISRAVKEEVQDINEVPNSKQAEMYTSTSTAPSFFYSHSPMVPCIWRPVFQHLDAIHSQQGSQNGSGCNVGEPIPFLGQENSTSNPGATPFYVLPFPWLIPFQTPGPYFPQSSDHTETSVLHQCSVSSSKTVGAEHPPRVFLPVKDETQDSNCTHKDDWNEAGFGFLSGLGTRDGIRQQLETHPKQQAALMCSPLTSVGQVTNAGATKISCLGGEVCDMNSRELYEEQGVLTCPSKNSADAIAAMEARKRRKELMKLKSHHCRPYHMMH